LDFGKIPERKILEKKNKILERKIPEKKNKTPPGGAGRPHPCAAQPPVRGFLHEFLEYSSTAS
jgi:hypothetical protein